MSHRALTSVAFRILVSSPMSFHRTASRSLALVRETKTVSLLHRNAESIHPLCHTANVWPQRFVLRDFLPTRSSAIEQRCTKEDAWNSQLHGSLQILPFLKPVKEDDLLAGEKEIEQPVNVRTALLPQIPELALKVANQGRSSVDVSDSRLLNRPGKPSLSFCVKAGKKVLYRTVSIFSRVENDRPVIGCHYTYFRILASKCQEGRDSCRRLNLPRRGTGKGSEELLHSRGFCVPWSNRQMGGTRLWWLGLCLVFPAPNPVPS